MGASEIIFVHNGDAKIIAVRALATQAIKALAAFVGCEAPHNAGKSHRETGVARREREPCSDRACQGTRLRRVSIKAAIMPRRGRAASQSTRGRAVGSGHAHRAVRVR